MKVKRWTVGVSRGRCCKHFRACLSAGEKIKHLKVAQVKSDQTFWIKFTCTMKLESNLQTATKSTLKLKVRDVQTPISKIIKTPHFTAKGFYMRTTKTSKCLGSVAEEVQCYLSLWSNLHAEFTNEHHKNHHLFMTSKCEHEKKVQNVLYTTDNKLWKSE